jgi:putative transposase
MSTARYYPTDLTEAQWALRVALLPARKWRPGGPGRPPCDVRRILSGRLCLLKTGRQWRMLPREFGYWSTVYASFRRWQRAGVGAKLMEVLRQMARCRVGRQSEPSAGSVESQSLKTAPQGQEVGCDGGKEVQGRKRHLLVDTLGLILAGVVTAAAAADRLGVGTLLTQDFAGGVRRWRKLWVEGGYRAEWVALWGRNLKHPHKVDLEVTDNAGPAFQVIPWRWAVGRTFAWLLNDRRHSRDYERLTVNSEALIQLSVSRVLLNRLA